MKTKLLVAFFLVTLFSFSQNGEFKTYTNGLIYSENSVNKLKHIVDSLNLKFKVCDINKKYKSISQTKAIYIQLNKKLVLSAKKDIENTISLSDFVKKYPKAIVTDEILVIKYNYYDEYDKKDFVEIRNIELDDRKSYSISKLKSEFNSEINTSAQGKWLFKYEPKSKYSSENIGAFYFLDNFESKHIAEKYSKLIQYSDCMVDTTAQVFRSNSKDSGVRYFDTISRKHNKFIDYIDTKLSKPKMSYNDISVMAGIDSLSFMNPKKISKKEKLKLEEQQKTADLKYEKFYKDLELWESKKLSKLDSLKINDINFLAMLNDAYLESKELKLSNDEFEEYVSIYISKEAALELKRNRRVIGGCSMDNSPRIHAFNIAILSAETIKWEIFLRSHLDIMNDRFDRVSDGSYAYGARKTYINELEVLNINVLDLILGISLRIENPAENHYFGSISRIGRALSESKDARNVETRLLEMISDNDLDDYNRILMYYLFKNYNSYVENENVKSENELKLKNALSKLPHYLAVSFQKN